MRRHSADILDAIALVYFLVMPFVVFFFAFTFFLVGTIFGDFI